jgi:hypothetical protein
MEGGREGERLRKRERQGGERKLSSPRWRKERARAREREKLRKRELSSPRWRKEKARARERERN